MAEKYACRPSDLWRSELGDFSFDLLCFMNDTRDQIAAQEKAKAESGRGSPEAPAWKG